MDHLINNDRKLPPEYNLPHTYVEMQVRGPSQAGGPGAESSWVWVCHCYLQRALIPRELVGEDGIKSRVWLCPSGK